MHHTSILKSAKMNFNGGRDRDAKGSVFLNWNQHGKYVNISQFQIVKIIGFQCMMHINSEKLRQKSC
jgi:hypothetical protein